MLKEEIKDFFQKALNIELVDSPQILEKYLYLEFEDQTGGERKFRISYPIDLPHFIMMEKGDRMLFILTAIVRGAYGQDV